MPGLKPVRTLYNTTNSYIVDKLRIYLDQHRTTCSTCICIGYFGMKPFLWNWYYDDSPNECSKVSKAINQIIECIPPDRLKDQINEYLGNEIVAKNKMSKNSENIYGYADHLHDVPIGFAIMAQLEKDFSRSTIKQLLETLRISIHKYCPYIDLITTPKCFDYELSEMKKNIKNVSLKLLNIYLSFSNQLVVLNLRAVHPADEVLELIGKHCNCLREIGALRLTCSMKGLKKLLFYNGEYNLKRNICKTLEQVRFTDSNKKLYFFPGDKEKTIKKMILVSRNCKKVHQFQEYKNQANILNLMYTYYHYIHPNITEAVFYESSGADYEQFLQTYPTVTHLTFTHPIFRNDHNVILGFENLVYLSIDCDFELLMQILNVRGNLLKTLIFNGNCFGQIVDFHRINEKCQNLRELEVRCYDCHFEFESVFQNIHSFTIDVTINREGCWNSALKLLLIKMPSLKHFKMGEYLSFRVSPNWILEAVNLNCFQTMETLSLEKCSLLGVKDIKEWICLCPSLRTFTWELPANDIKYQTLKNDLKYENVDVDLYSCKTEFIS